MIPWKWLVNLLPTQGWVAGKLAFSWKSESGWVAGSTSQVISRQRKVKGQSSLLSTVLCWVKLFATLSKVSKELMVHFLSGTPGWSVHRHATAKWQDHGWTPLAWDWPSIVGLAMACAPSQYQQGRLRVRCPVPCSHCSHHRYHVAPSSGFATPLHPWGPLWALVPSPLSTFLLGAGQLPLFLPPDLATTELHPPQNDSHPWNLGGL